MNEARNRQITLPNKNRGKKFSTVHWLRIQRLSLSLLLLSLYFGCANIRLPKASVGSNVLLITIDTLRADHLGCHNYNRIKTPNIDNLAHEGVVFTQAYTPVPITLPSHTTIMTGFYPIQTGVRNNGTCQVSEEITTLAEILHQQGYRTAAFVSAYVLDSRYGLDQGFDYYDDALPAGEQVMFSYNERKAEQVTQSAMEWLGRHAGSEFFTWIHYFDPHAGYNPPAPFAEQYTAFPYDGEIAYTDHWIGVLINRLKKLKVLDNTLIIVTSDHGEGLGEHGEQTHAIFIYDTTLHVPLILRYPKKLPIGKTIHEFVRTLDIMPTIVSILGFPSPPCQGIDLLKVIEGREKDLKLNLYCESLYPKTNYGWSPLEGIRCWDWKYIKAPQPELYHLVEDPFEKHNLYGRQNNPLLHKHMEEEKRHLINQNVFQPVEVTIDSESEERLKKLGYIRVGKESVTHNENAGLLDPKDMIHTQQDIDRAINSINKGEYEKAKNLLLQVVSLYPDNVFAHLTLGQVLAKLNRLHEAREEFLHVKHLNPLYGDVQFCLGTLYLKEEEYEKAVREFTESLQVHKDYYEVFYNLGLACMQLGREDQALENFQKALSLASDHADLHNNIGVILALKGKTGEAIKAYLKALQLDPQNIRIYQNLTSLYQKQGQWKDAQKIGEKALIHFPDNPDLYHKLAYFALQKEEAPLARTFLDQGLKLDPSHAGLHNIKGIFYFKQQQDQEARLEFEQALKTNPLYKEAWYNLARVYEREWEKNQKDDQGQEDEQAQKAKQCYQEVLRIEPAHLLARLHMAGLCDKLGETKTAVTLYEEVLQIDPQNSQALLNLSIIHYYLGNAALSQKDFQRALAEYQKGLQINPDNAEAHFGLGLVYMNQGKAAEAIKEWEEAIRLDQDISEARANLALAYANRGDSQAALNCLQPFLQPNPTVPLSYKTFNKIGRVYQALGDYHKAKEHFEKALTLNPNDFNAYYNIGSLLITTREFDPAIENFQTLLQLNPAHLEGRVNLALAYIGKGMYWAAFQEIEKAQQINPDMPQIYQCLGILYMRTGRFSEALSCFQAMARLQTQDSPTLNTKPGE